MINAAILPALFAGCIAPCDYAMLNKGDEDKFITEVARRGLCQPEAAVNTEGYCKGRDAR